MRRPPRGVAKPDWAKRDFFDVWLPELAPSEALLKAARAAETEAEWKAFTRRYRSEMAKPEAQHLLQLLSVLSHTTAFSVGCYCENEQRPRPTPGSGHRISHCSKSSTSREPFKSATSSAHAADSKRSARIISLR